MNRFKQASSFNADEAELRAIREGVSSAVVGAYDERLSKELIDFAKVDLGESPFRRPEWETQDAAETDLVGRALDVIKLRRELLGRLYPFRIDGSQLSYQPGVSPIYEFLLATSEAVSHGGRDYQRLVRHFERIAAKLVAAFLGPDSISCRFGWPSEDFFERMPTKFHPRVDRMRSECRFGDDEWKINSSSLQAAQIQKMKDGKIDFIVRRPIVDARVGSFAVVGQCGCGREDVREESNKHREVNSDWLANLFDQTTVPRPVLVFATSQHIVCEGQLESKQQTGQALLFDRVRLVLQAAKTPIGQSRYELWMSLLTRFVKENPPKSIEAA